MQFILSPCGTSLLTNQADQENRSLIFRYANEKHKDDIPAKDRKKLENLINKVAALLHRADNQKAMKMSAELNGIIQIYDGKITKRNDFHLLLSTDTWLGEETAKLVKSWLEMQNLKANIHRQTDLQTYDISSFQLSLSELIKTLSEIISGYSKAGYKIIFNLTGGFKSVQGFLQSIANFYADEVVYIFEASSNLLRIPKIPVKLDLSIIENRIDIFRKLSLGIDVNKDQLKGIPETLLLTLDNQTTLSPWGELLWEQSKEEIYGKNLIQSPINRIKYAKDFEKTVSNLPKDRMILVNKRVDQLAQFILTGHNPRSLDFKPIKGKAMAPSTHEIDAWSDKDAKRIFGHYENDVFILDRLDKGLH